jgi:peptidoglycan/xylan/chitin deacetylase (PgdA/CDA1 family)
MAKVLMFHRVLPEKQIKQFDAYSYFGTLISQEYFNDVLSLLIDKGFKFVNISDIEKHSKSDKLVAITFDDGYIDNFEFALPSLIKYNSTATFFPIVNPIINNTVLPLDIYYQCVDEMKLTEEERKDFIVGENKMKFYWSEPNKQWDLLKSNFAIIPNQNRVSYMQPHHIKYLANAGFEIGSHSLTHSLFTAEYMNEMKINFELKQSKNYLEEIIGKSVNSFCFPSGYYNKRLVEIAKENGYTSVCLINKSQKLELLDLPSYERIFVKPNSIKELEIKLENK